MNKDEIKKIVLTELDLSIGGDADSDIESNRENALDYYHGNLPRRPSKDRSGIVSTDVADAIEWILPQVIKALTQTNEVVTFDPTGDGDDDQAQLESEYVYSVLMKENPGFLILYTFVKDMLLQKNGIIKAFYDDDKKESIEPYTGINELQLMAIMQSPEVELLEMSQYESEAGQVGDIKIKRVKDNGKIDILPVPPEEFRINNDHNSSDISEARFVAHVSRKTESDLIEAGYDKKIIEDLPSYTNVDEEDRFSSQGEYIDEDTSQGQRLIEVSECYMQLDVNDAGIAERQKITLAGHTILEIEAVEEHPLISATAIIMPHKWAGLSIYDRLKEIQDQKTALIRNIFDNIYLQNNQRLIVGPGTNLDDVMTNRPGGLLRTEIMGSVMPVVTQSLGAEPFALLDKLSEVSAGRSGVSPEGAAQAHMVGTDTAHGIERLMTAKEELVGLIVRVVAETGLKPLCLRIRELLRRHVDSVQEYKFRNQWMKLNPAEWKDRSRVSVRVGLGSGDKQNQLNAMTQVLMYQEKVMLNPQQSMVQESQVFNAINDFSKLAGLTTARNYFTDPSSEEGQKRKQEKEQQGQQTQQQQQQMQLESIEAQKQIAIAETKKAEAAQAGVQVKSQIENLKIQMQQQNNQSKAEIEWLKTELAHQKDIATHAKDSAEVQYKYDKLDSDEALELTKMEIDAQKELNSQVQDNYGTL